MKKTAVAALYILLFFLLISLILRVALFNIFLTHNSIQTLEYSDIAKNIVSGNGYTYNYLGTLYRSYGTPLYPALIAIIYKFAGITNSPIVYLQITLSLLSGLVLFFIARRIANENAALIASIIFLFHPGLVLYSVKSIHSLQLDIFLFLLAVISVMRLREKMSFANAAVTGLAFGMAALSRPSIAAFAFISVLWLFVGSGTAFKTKMFSALLLISIAAIPVSVWIVRNYAVHKKIIMTTTCDAEVFWRGNNKNATGASHQTDGMGVLEHDKELYDKLITLNELDKRELFRKEATQFIINNPGKAIMLYLKKIYYFWWFSPVSGILYPHSYLFIYRVFYSMMLFFAVIGLISLFKKKDDDIRKNVCLLLLFLILTSLFQAMYYVEGRHRWGVEPILLIFSAAGITAFMENVGSFIIRKSRR